MKQLNNFISAFSAKPLMLLTFLALLPTLANAQCPDNNHPHMIDLGLPSGTKWACCNVGASKPEDYGGYYAWGETEEKDVYSYETYIYGYNEYIGLDISGTNYDVAHVKWGVSWKMPTTEDFKELIDNCTYIWTQQDGTEGSKFTGNNGNSIFIPDAGWNSPDNHDATRNSLCWTSSLVQSDGRVAYMFAGNRQGTPFHEAPMNRPYGLAVRPVVAGSSTLSGIAIDETNFPDENFRNWVLAQDYGQDGVLTEDEVAAVSSIDVDNNGITDLKGIEFFTALTSLYCNSNQLTSLDVSKNIALEWFACSWNQLTSLDVSKNTALKGLYCYGNQLTSLDVSKNTALAWLGCFGNNIKGTGMDALIAGLPSTGGQFDAISTFDSSEQNVVTKAQVAAARDKGWKIYNVEITPDTWYYSEYEGSDPEIAPVDQGETIDIGNEIDENTNLDGNVVGDVYYCISSGDGSYDPEEGCVVVTKPTDDSVIDGKDIFGEDFKAGYTGFVFMVAPGKGTINVEAETTGNMVLKVRVGDNAPTQMEVDGKTKVSFSYDVSEPTMVFIYGSIAAAGAKGVMKAAGTDALKIYGIEVTSETNGIEAIDNGQLTIDNSPVYNLNGQRVESSMLKVQNSKLPKGVYIQNGKKVLVK